MGAARPRSASRGRRGSTCPGSRKGKEVEYLYWVGCSASYDRRNQSIARAVVKMLRGGRACSFAVMPGERCSGEAARRLGEEYLYQTLANENVENLKQYRFKKVLHALPALLQHDRERVPPVRRRVRGASTTRS